MKEKPNLSYINQLSGGDKIFEGKLLSVIKRELPEEAATYRTSIKNKDFTEAAVNVHKLKHKISILGLEESYLFAENYEEELREDKNVSQSEFEEILHAMSAFIEEF
ncbi:Hpt domain-containing protein [Flavimarina sp. Hel_I_48]|uniref:Hpt domain-containing protein n=1 Tax=Flavimarina sp. Hel_I_48 TaxID=1392488 RepID=UPI0004DEE040|nr:Hpt domain-containing protein [Flavimarina sp. Hel_I_48]